MSKPFSSTLDFKAGSLKNYDEKVVRRLSDMSGMYYDDEAYNAALKTNDSVIYEVLGKKVEEKDGELAHAVTIIFPGKVGNEYHMTKGHFHEVEGTAELYLGISGEGGIIMETEDGKSEYIEMKPGTLVYVSPDWAHRTINTSDEKFTFLAIYPAHAGHDYSSVEEKGFKEIVVEKDGKPQLIDNPNR